MYKSQSACPPKVLGLVRAIRPELWLLYHGSELEIVARSLTDTIQLFSGLMSPSSCTKRPAPRNSSR